MEFRDGLTIDDIVDRDVDLHVPQEMLQLASKSNCQTFLRDGQLWIDCFPALNRKYAFPVPADAIISRDELRIDAGRLGVYVPPRSPLGSFVVQLNDMNRPRK